MTAALHLVTSNNENRQVVPTRSRNADLRSREYLTVAEVEKLMKAARDGRYGHRDATLILIAFRHGLRAVEICDLEWSQVEFSRNASLHVRRVKNGTPSVHPLRGDELRALRELRRNSRIAHSYLPLNVVARSLPTPSIDKSRLSVNALVCPSRFMPTCCVMPVAMPWPMRGMIRGAFSPGLGIGASSIRCATLSYRRHRSRISGAARTDTPSD